MNKVSKRIKSKRNCQKKRVQGVKGKEGGKSRKRMEKQEIEGKIREKQPAGNRREKKGKQLEKEGKEGKRKEKKGKQ